MRLWTIRASLAPVFISLTRAVLCRPSRECGIAFRFSGAFTRSAGVNTNSGDVSFGNAAGGATFSHWASWDAASGGNMLMSGTITGGPYTVGANTLVKFAAGQLTETVD